MTQSKQYSDASPAANALKRKSKLAHWVRVAVMFLSGGFIFPNAMTEEEDRDIVK